MRSIFTRSFAAAIVALGILTSFAHDASAQGSYFPKKVPIVWQRLNAGSDNPFGSLPVAQPYGTDLSNGNHNAANLGVAVGVEDTSQAIPIFDHWLKAAQSMRSTPAFASTLLADSSWGGSILFTTNSSTIDTVTYFLDHSVDGKVWTVRDSLQGHVISDRLALTLGAVSDSARVALASFSAANGAVGTSAGISITMNPYFSPGGVTAQSIVGINYLRLRVHMTPGDFAAAGATRGIRADFVYPAVDANQNQANRVSQ
jgi:hypothetical protein